MVRRLNSNMRARVRPRRAKCRLASRCRFSKGRAILRARRRRRAMDVRAADALFNGSVIALVAAAATVVLDLFGFLNVAIAASFVLGSCAAFAFSIAATPE